ncbi:MAG: 30S ribosomal protein S9 [Lentimicrobiaceae bacterium]|nr:30S ribosomal protein S9 [Lentimicrobiaceae bacterium]
MENILSVGRRKKAIARVFMKPGNGSITVNGKDYKEYFPTPMLQNNILQPLQITENLDKYDVVSTIKGGGMTGQAEALRLGIARTLIEQDAELRPALKAKGMLRRDPRMVERKKFGQKKARKRFQFSKR